MTSNIDVVKTWLRRVWAEEDETAIDDMLVTDTKALGLAPDTLVGPDGFKQFHRLFLSRLCDFDIQVDRYMEDGEWMSVLVTLNARRRDNKQPVKTTGHIYFRIVDGMVLQGDNHFDFMRLLEQMGNLPENTFEECLSGRVLS